MNIKVQSVANHGEKSYKKIDQLWIDETKKFCFIKSV